MTFCFSSLTHSGFSPPDSSHWTVGWFRINENQSNLHFNNTPILKDISEKETSFNLENPIFLISIVPEKDLRLSPGFKIRTKYSNNLIHEV